jgi:Uma2 family endonuclease
MEAATVDHGRILANLVHGLKTALKSSGCEPLPVTRTATSERGLYTYPDIIVVCGKVETWPVNRDTVSNPRVIIEVLSKSTEGYDRGKKFDLYTNLPSFVEYLTVAQDSAWILHHVRQPEGDWRLRPITGLDAVLRFATIPAELALRDVYEGVEFEAAS